MRTLRNSGIAFACLGIAVGAGFGAAFQADVVPHEWAFLKGPAALAGVLLAAFGAVSLILPYFAKPPATAAQLARTQTDINQEADSRHKETTSELVALSADMSDVKRFLAEIREGRPTDAPPPDPQVEAAQERAVEGLLASNDPLDQNVRNDIARGDVDGAIAALLDAASQDRAKGAARYRDAGLLAYDRDVSTALQAFEDAAALEPNDIWTHIYISRLSRAVGDTTRASAAAHRAVEIDSDDRDQSCALSEFGDVARQEGDLPAARRAYGDSLTLFRILVDSDPQNADWQRDLAIIHNKLGDVARLEGDLSGARQAYEDGLVIFKALADNDPQNTIAQRDLSVSYNKIGDVARQEGDVSTARKAYEDSLAIRKALTDLDSQSAYAQRDLSISYNRLGDIARQEGDLATARIAYGDSLDIFTMLAERDPRNADWQRNLSVGYNKLGDIARREGDLATARKAYEDGLAIATALAARDPRNAEWQRDLAVSYERMGQVAFAVNDHAAARSFWTQELNIATRLSDADPTNLGLHRFIAAVHMFLADLNEKDAVDQMNRARNLLEELDRRGRLAPADRPLLDQVRAALPSTERTSDT